MCHLRLKVTGNSLLNMSDSLSFDRRKFQFCLAITAINVVWGLNVVTRGIRSVGSGSLVRFFNVSDEEHIRLNLKA